MNTIGHFVTAKVLVNSQWSVEEGKQALEAYCQQMNKEKGCLQALALQDNHQPRRFVLWECYLTPEDHQHHFTLPHTQAFIKAEWVTLVDVVESTRI